MKNMIKGILSLRGKKILIIYISPRYKKKIQDVAGYLTGFIEDYPLKGLIWRFECPGKKKK